MKSTDRMHLTSEESTKLQDRINSDPVLWNAYRLFRDGDLLFENERFASVVALSVLTLEEIGKHLLNLWTEEDPTFKFDKRKYHQSKQAAIAALFMSDSARKEVGSRMRSHTLNFNRLPPEKQTAIVFEAVQIGIEKETAFAHAVMEGAINIVKFSGLYFDPDLADRGVEPEKIDEAAARELMEQCAKAFILLIDEANAEIARIAYDLIYPPAKNGGAQA